MSSSSDRMREEDIKARILRHLAQHHRERDLADMAEANRRGRLLQSEPEKPLADVRCTSAASASWTRTPASDDTPLPRLDTGR